MLIVVGFACILHATTRLVKLYEHGGKQHDRYRELAQAVFGACGCLPLPSAAPRPNTLHPVVPDRAARKRATNWLVYLDGGQAALRQHAADPDALCPRAAGKPREELGGDSLPAHRQHRHLCYVSCRRQPVPAVHLSGHHRRGHCSSSSSTDGTGSSSGRSGGGTAGCLRLTWWIFILSAAQLLFRLLPDINFLASVTALGAATNLGFSALATVGAALHGMHAAAACWTALQLSVVDARLLKCHCALLLGGAA